MSNLTLTFDNGPDPGVTPAVLDILARRGIRTAFFVIGNKLAERGPRACAERAHAEGHWIGNHTWTHTIPLGEQPGLANADEEITQTQTALGPLVHPARWFRPMGGGGNLDRRLLNTDAVTLLQRDRYSCVLWNAIPRDWADPDGWTETALHQVAEQDWTLMVLHDLPTGAMAHLERFLDTVQDRGVQLRQDFPPDCVPIAKGVVVSGVDHLTST